MHLSSLEVSLLNALEFTPNSSKCSSVASVVILKDPLSTQQFLKQKHQLVPASAVKGMVLTNLTNLRPFTETTKSLLFRKLLEPCHLVEYQDKKNVSCYMT